MGPFHFHSQHDNLLYLNIINSQSRHITQRRAHKLEINITPFASFHTIYVNCPTTDSIAYINHK